MIRYLDGLTIYRVSPGANCDGCRPGWLPQFYHKLDLCERHERQLVEYSQEFGTLGAPMTKPTSEQTVENQNVR